MTLSSGDARDWIAEPALIAKYRPGAARYLTYPGAERFGEDFGPGDAREWLRQRGEAVPDAPLAISVRLPTDAPGDARGSGEEVAGRDLRAFLACLEREIVTQRGALGRDEEVADLHWTGGGPGFPSVEEVSRILESLRGHFRFQPRGDLRIELGPWGMSPEAIEGLGAMGFTSLSIRAFDLDPVVLRRMGWSLSREETMRAIAAGRAAGFRTVNLELLHGLPAQSAQGFARTLETVGEFRPDRVRLAVFDPSDCAARGSIDPGELPGERDRALMLASALDRLAAAGYVPVGMDEFALAADELAVARAGGSLYRDLHGYTTRAPGARLAFGVAAISSMGAGYGQNHASPQAYCARLDRGELPVRRGHRLDADDVLRREIIDRLACELRLGFEDLRRRFAVDFGRYFGPEAAELEELAGDGLIVRSADGLEVTPLGLPLLGAVCGTFDRYRRAGVSRGAPRHVPCSSGMQQEGSSP